jgi:hypothetical protein
MANGRGGEELAWAHIGDLHITAENEPNYRDFYRLSRRSIRILRIISTFACFPKTTPVTERLSRCAVYGHSS